MGATSLIDSFAFLKLVPERFLGHYVSLARDVGEETATMYSELIDRVRLRREKAGSKNSMMDQVLDAQGKLQLNHSQLIRLGGISMEGGTDTLSLLLSSVLAMVKWPAVQQKAQAEIDAVIREDRSPLWSDRPRLPYILMLMKETQRWRPAAPLGAHSLTQGN